MKKYLALMMLLACAVSGCKKFLDAKPDKKLLLPDNIEAVQAMLDNDNTMNQFCPGTGEASADNYYVTDASWASLSSLATLDAGHFAGARRPYHWVISKPL